MKKIWVYSPKIFDGTPSGAYGDLWGPMGLYGDLWGPMAAYGDL